MKRFITDPLFVFLSMGLALFLVFQQFDSNAPAERGIVVDASAVRYFRAALTQQSGEAPSNEKLTEVLQQYIRDEAMYREALRLGTDKHDQIVRRRLVQTVEFMYQERGEQQLEETCAANVPTEALQPIVVADFEQRFFNNGAGVTSEALMLKRAPDMLPIGQTFKGTSPEYVRAQLGDAVTRAVFDLPTNTWHGPLPSTLGTHWVRVTSRRTGGKDSTEKNEWLLSCIVAGRRAQLDEAVHDLIKEQGLTIAKDVAAEFPELTNAAQPATNLQARTGAP